MLGLLIYSHTASVRNKVIVFNMHSFKDIFRSEFFKEMFE